MLRWHVAIVWPGLNQRESEEVVTKRSRGGEGGERTEADGKYRSSQVMAKIQQMRKDYVARPTRQRRE